jgi:hypothetical protein
VNVRNNAGNQYNVVSSIGESHNWILDGGFWIGAAAIYFRLMADGFSVICSPLTAYAKTGRFFLDTSNLKPATWLLFVENRQCREER